MVIALNEKHNYSRAHYFFFSICIKEDEIVINKTFAGNLEVMMMFYNRINFL